MESGGGAESVDAGSQTEGNGNPPSDALTSTDDLRAGIAQTYGLGPMGQYSPSLSMGRFGNFYSSFQSAPPPKVRERRNPFVLQTFLKQNMGVNVYQPTGYSVQRDLQAADNLQQDQFFATNTAQDPVDAAFSTGKPMLDKKIKDAPRPEEEGRLVKETDLRRRAIHVSKGRKDQYDYDLKG